MRNPPIIDGAMVQNLADLARLHLPVERQALLLQRLQRIVEAFDALRQVPTEQSPANLPSLPPLCLRPDVAEPPLPIAQVFANTRHHAAAAFVVPRIVDA